MPCCLCHSAYDKLQFLLNNASKEAFAQSIAAELKFEQRGMVVYSFLKSDKEKIVQVVDRIPTDRDLVNAVKAAFSKVESQCSQRSTFTFHR